MLELEGIYAPFYRISFLKVNIYHHPEEFGREVRLVFNIILEIPNGSLSQGKQQGRLEIFLNTKPGVEIVGIEDLSHKTSEDYSSNIGACWTPGKEEKEHKVKILRITNIPKKMENTEKVENHQEKFPYFDISTGRIKINLEFEGLVVEKDEKNKELVVEKDEKNEGMIFFALYLKGNFLEEDPWWKKLLGISSYAWEFSYIFWSHNEKSLIPAQSIGECKEAQTFIIIPKKMIKSINRVSCIPGSDHLHEITDNDIATYCDSENKKESIEEIKKWIEPGSFSLTWNIPGTLKISKEIVLGHLDAYPRLVSTLLFSFIVLLNLIYLFWPNEKSRAILASLIILIILFFFISAINYSFHNIRQSQISRGLYETGGITLFCFILSFGLYGPLSWKLLGFSISDIEEISWIYIFLATFIIFVFVSYRKEKEFYSPQDSKLTPAIIIVTHCIVIFAISIFFAHSFENLGNISSIGLGNYSEIFKYWALNNLYATLGIKGSHKLIEL